MFISCEIKLVQLNCESNWCDYRLKDLESIYDNRTIHITPTNHLLIQSITSIALPSHSFTVSRFKTINA